MPFIYPKSYIRSHYTAPFHITQLFENRLTESAEMSKLFGCPWNIDMGTTLIDINCDCECGGRIDVCSSLLIIIDEKTHNRKWSSSIC